MRILSRGALCAFLLFALSSAAQSGPSSNGDFQFSLDGASGAIQYNVKQDGSGARGDITFTGAMAISNEDVDGEGVTVGAVSNVSITVSADCLRVSGNQAAMSGVVSSSSVPEYIGIRALLAVEDNGEGVKAARDRFTWGVYRSHAATWIPEDAEVPGDTGYFLTWIATDAERNDDAGVPSNKSNVVDCQSFPFGSYAFEIVAHGAGNIQVKP